MTIYVGVDPGVDGGVAMIEGEVVRTWPMPFVGEVQQQKTMVDSAAIRMIFGAIYKHRPDIRVGIENNWSRGQGTKQGNFEHGYTCGIASALCAMMGVEPTMFNPSSANNWAKKYLGVGKEKSERIAAALALYPQLAFGRITDGQADAVLIARVCMMLDAPESVPAPAEAVSLCEILGRDDTPVLAI